MNLIQLIKENKLEDAKNVLIDKLASIIDSRLKEAKQYILHPIDESSNIIRSGRVQTIRRRIRRDSKGKIIVQKNARRSAISGYQISGKSVRRISAIEKMRRRLQLKKSWRTSRRAKLSRTLLKRKMSMRRRYSMGLR